MAQSTPTPPLPPDEDAGGGEQTEPPGDSETGGAPAEEPLAAGARLPGMAAFAGPVSWAVVLAGLPAVAATAGLAYLAHLHDGALGAWLDAASVLVLQLAWIGPTLIAPWTLRAALPQLRRPALRLRVLAPGFFLAFLLALPFALVPAICLPMLVFGPVPVVQMSIARLVDRS